jgi:uncharacterized protein
MKLYNNTLHLSASDLSSHIACTHLSQLKLKVAKGELTAPAYYAAELDALRQKGEEMERNFLDSLKAEGKRVVEIARDDREAGEKTLLAMREGVDVIYQARLKDGAWGGWADFLVKSGSPSPVLGSWSYEVVDTKLARETKSGAILQICLYSDILARHQGVQPEYMYIRNPLGEEPYRVDDFMAYYRLMRRKLEEAVAVPLDTYPEPVAHCAVCDWFEHCNRQRREDDHLSFIAGMGTGQMREVRNWGINTLDAMSRLPLPLTQTPTRGSVETYERLREQARLQCESRNRQETVYEILEPEAGFGFYLLPASSPGDIFLDFEGDPYVESSGREYLFGWVIGKDYLHFWAESEAVEKKKFEDFIDGVMKVREKYPDMHIYHFAAYEPSALKRLMGKYGTRENEVDTLLRAKCFVDLHTVVRQSVRAGVESYSLKDLERLHGFTRQRALREVGKHKMQYETLLENGLVHEATEEMRQVIREYNEDDCRSTFHLRAWLETERTDLLQKGYSIPRPEPQNGEAGENVTAHQERIRPLFEALMKGVPVESLERSEEQQARWLLAHMLDWYRCEKKSFWWDYFRLLNLPPEELIDERMAVGGLEYTGEREPVRRSVIDNYRFPPQDTDIRVGDTVRDQSGSSIGTVEDIDPEHGMLRIKRGLARADAHPPAVIVHQDINSTVKEEAIIRLAEDVIAHGLEGEGSNRPARALLLRQSPGASETVRRETDPQQQAILWVRELDGSVLPIQGPPGTGKSHTAAQMIIELIRLGKTVGITALSHKVIAGLLRKVQETAQKARLAISMVKKGGEAEGNGHWISTDDNNVVHMLLSTGQVQVAAGTPFMWSRREFAAAVDVMFVDEAGQLSLIDTLALSHAAGSLVLLGDPQQLSQPQQGTHPEGTEVSALEHLLQEHKTIQQAQGVFLSETWRMHPAVCGYISELFYEGRLESRPQNARQSINGANPFPSAGLVYAPVVHAGNRNASPEEVTEVQQIIRKLVNGKTEWVDNKGKRKKITTDDILVIAPYNAQVGALAEALHGVRVGTVDKFQGQEAPVVIFSMATSSPEEAPRGMEFLYSLNRLNVAVSRAKALCILVASEKLFEPDCKSPHQMRLANALCRFREMVG